MSDLVIFKDESGKLAGMGEKGRCTPEITGCCSAVANHSTNNRQGFTNEHHSSNPGAIHPSDD